MRESCVVRLIFWFAALVFSSFHGWFAVTIHVVGGKKRTYCSERQNPELLQHHWSWWLHQIWLNFFGSLVGWATAYYLIFYRYSRTPSPEINYADVFFILLALLGVCGFLPWRLFNTSIR
jgi:hypothetical protein